MLNDPEELQQETEEDNDSSSNNMELLLDLMLTQEEEEGANNDNDDEEEEDEQATYRCNLARGLVRMSEAPIELNPAHDAPPFVMAFELVEFTSLPYLLLDIIGALTNIKSIIEKGERGAFITGLPGFQVRKDGQFGKSVIYRKATDGQLEQLNEINIQIRIQEVCATIKPTNTTTTTTTTPTEQEEEDNDGGVLIKEYFALLIAESPLPFSIRKAAHITTRSVGRLTGLDARGADLRRKIWAQAAMHVREEFSPRMSPETLLTQYCQTMDWMNNTGPDGFTALFSMQRAIDWMKLRFLSKHTQRRHPGYGFASLFRVQGVERRLRLQHLIHTNNNRHGGGGGDDFFVEPVFCEACQVYDVDVDREIQRSNPVGPASSSDKKKKTQRRAAAANKNKRGGRGAPQQEEQRRRRAEEEEEHQEEEAEEDEEKPYVTPYAGVELAEDGKRGIPRCMAAMRVILQTTVEKPMGMLEVRHHLRTLPESVMLILLGAHQQQQREEEEEPRNNEEGEQPKKRQKVSLAEMREIVMGDGEFTLGRPMLSAGDALWGTQMMTNLLLLPPERRLPTLCQFVAMGFALAFTRAQGSDGYHNGRVATYGRVMLHEDGALSRKECRAAHRRSLRQIDHHFEGNPTDAALRFSLDTLVACDSAGWNLRPDNLFLVMQLLVSDLMQCLNFHDSVIGGAANGIGGTLIVRDGGGSYRKRFKDPNGSGMQLGQIYSKTYSTGADTSVNAIKKAMNAVSYDARFPFPHMPYEELKRVTETSLIHNSCMVLEHRDGTVVTKHVIENADKRYYSTEMKAGGDQQSQSNMTAITWLIWRNTSGAENNRFITTREDPNSKERMSVEFQQVIGGYWILCSNWVSEASRERFKTIVAVSRSVVSSANGLGMEDVLRSTQSDADLKEHVQREEQCSAQNGTVDQTVGSSHEEELIKAGRPLFFTAMGTICYTAFMQWTGMLARIRETRRAEAILRVFYAQLELCKDLLNPDMASRGDKGRFLHVSKARSIAVSLLGIGMRETLTAGRRNASQQSAVEAAAVHFKCEGGAGALSWVVADTLEHMFRLDFLLLMTMLARHLHAPRVGLDELLEWLRSGRPEACPAAEAFFQDHRGAIDALGPQACEERGMGFVATMMSDGKRLLPCEHCLYLSAPELRTSTRPETWSSNEGFARFCHGTAVELHRLFWKPLHEFCQIEPNEDGAEVLRGMLLSTVNQPFAWPSVFGAADALPDFWKGRAPPDMPVDQARSTNASLLRDLARLTLPPLRMIGMEVQRARLGVDLRWLLLMNALGHGQLAQSARFSAVSQLTQHFFRHCVPNELTPARHLFTGLPSQVTGTGFLWPEVLRSQRHTLRRPGFNVGMDGFTRSRMVEDMGVAAPRYELANMLGVDERSLPTECVTYELPYLVWIPVLLGVNYDDNPGAVCWKEDGGLWLCAPGLPLEGKLLSSSSSTSLFLGGRSTMPVRPTCMFSRPGVLVRIAATGLVARRRRRQQQKQMLLGLVAELLHHRGLYRIYTRPEKVEPEEEEAEPATTTSDDDDDDEELEERFLTPYQIEAALFLHGTLLRCTLASIQAANNQHLLLLPTTTTATRRVMVLTNADGGVTRQVGSADDDDVAVVVVGMLEYQRVDQLPPFCIALRMQRATHHNNNNNNAAATTSFLGAASHGHVAQAHLDDRLAPCIFVHISGVLGQANHHHHQHHHLTHCAIR